MNSVIYLAFLLIGLQVQCHHQPGHDDDKDGDGHTNVPLDKQHENKSKYFLKIAPSNAKFAFSVYKHIVSDAAAKNVLFSPVSISIACAMLSLGAKSETLHQIYRGLAFNLSEIEEKELHKGFHHLVHALNHPNNTEQVNVGNALFVSESLKVLPNFLEDINALYDTEGFSTNFKDPPAAEKQINSYVQNKTHGKITHAVEGLDESIVMILVNYIFFKAYWKAPFNTKLTHEEDFVVDINTTVKVPQMVREGSYKILHDEELSCWAVEVPYEGHVSAIFILPDEGKLNHVERALLELNLPEWIASFQPQQIRLSIPKFSVAVSFDIKDLLQKLGVTDVFNDNADLSGITGRRNLKVSKATHKAFMNVNESGTEAAAVTVIEISPRCCGPSITIKFNKPFLITVYDKKIQNTLFMGKIVDPTQD